MNDGILAGFPVVDVLVRLDGATFPAKAKATISLSKSLHTKP
jgi:translation elongation factor EF-G